MITKRIIPCLDVKDGRVVKGVQFEGLGDVSSPIELAAYYSANGADELVFYDITASSEGRAIFTDILRETARQVFIPLTVGGGIRTLEDFERVLNCGADKVSVNSGAIETPALIREAALRYGSQCVVLSVDVKRVGEEFRVFAKGGREDTGMEALEWIKQGIELGAGELVINSIDTDGLRTGFDLPLLEAVCAISPFRWSPRAGRAAPQTSSGSFRPSPVWTRGLPPRSSTSSRWRSPRSRSSCAPRAFPCGWQTAALESRAAV